MNVQLSVYIKLYKVGNGSFGDVFKIKNKYTGHICAAKISRDQIDESFDIQKSIQNEISIISRLNHPAILKFIGYSPINFQKELKPVIITEIVNNGSLKDIISLSVEAQNEIGWNDTLKLINIYGIAHALSYLHSKDILHRDLKPANILIDDFLCPKVADFGLSKIIHHNNESMSSESGSKFKGTPIYTAPEIWEEAKYTKAGDVYAFAIVVYQIVTNKVPYKNINNYAQICKKVIFGDRPKIDSNIPNSYRSLIEKCWAQDMSERPTFDQILQILRTDSGFIVPKVDKNDFILYIKYINQFYDDSNNKRIINKIDEFARYTSQNFIQKFANPKYQIEEIFNLAQIFEKRDKNQYNMKEAARLFKIAADYGHVDGMYKIGYLLFYGQGIKIDKKEGCTYLKRAADKGNNEAMFLYAWALSHGEGVQINQAESCYYYEMASNKGHLDSMNNYALKLLNGSGIDKDIQKANSLFKKAADEGHIRAMYNYGRALKNGIGIPIDKKEAAKYLKMSADKGYKDAMITYGKMLRFGDGIPIDRRKAKHYLETDFPQKQTRKWYQLESLADFEIYEDQFIKEPRIKKGKVISTSQPVIVKYTINYNIDDIKHECDILINCSHPSIQKLIGLYISSNNNPSAMITKYCENGSLDSFLCNSININDNVNENKEDGINEYEDDEEEEDDDDEGTEEDYLYKIAYHICQAMKYLEDQKMFHGNLNPTNILLDEYYNPIVNNIKMKEKYSNDDIFSDMMINYLAPEIILGNKCTIKSDVYSYGLIIEQLFTKRIPYSSIQTKQELINIITNEDIKYSISQNVPKFLIEITEKCLDKDPQNRPSFKNILESFEKSFSNNSFIKKFQKWIDFQIQCPITFFRVPKTIVKSIEDKEIKEKPNQVKDNKDEIDLNCEVPELEKILDQTLISFENLEKIFSTVSRNREIKIIMVCGKFQSGKSTLLRTLTGNGAFYCGRGEKSTTMGLVIDGPYDSEDLIKRIVSKSYQKPFLNDKIKLKNNPAIFFIDSQGIGDEGSQDYSAIMKRYLSVFCSLSDICINITDMKEHVDVFDEIINTIRRGQLMKMKFEEGENEHINNNFNKKITKLMFLVRNVQELHLDIKKKRSFKRIQDRFQPIWNSQHQIASKYYFPNLFKVLPLGNLIDSPSTYTYSVWNILPDIFDFLNNSHNYTKDYIETKLENAAIFLFSDFFDKFNKTDEKILHITNVTLQIIDIYISKFNKGLIDKETTIGSIYQIINIIINIIIPFSIGQNTDLSYQNYNQYIYDLMKDLTVYIKKNIPELENNLIQNAYELFREKILFLYGCGGLLSGFVGGALGATALNVGRTVVIEIANKVIPLFIPGGVVLTIASIATTIISIGSYFVSFYSKYTSKCHKIQEITKQNIEISIPFLWNKIDDSQMMINKMPTVPSPKKILSLIKRSNLIIVLENGKSNFMKFIIQCMTGVICNYDEQVQNTKETILYGPFEPKYLLNRISRYYPKFKSAMTQKIFILYLRDYDEGELMKLKPIQEKAMLFLSSNKSIGTYPSLVYKQFHMFYFVQKPDIQLLIKEDCTKIQEQLDKSINKNGYNITFLPILMKDDNSFNDIGPQTNKNLRWAFHYILKNIHTIEINV